ncbi:MAG TPA: hypothetical protein VGF43_04800 [Dongiaceae bacterium]|jgi:hypothetical protein
MRDIRAAAALHVQRMTDRVQYQESLVERLQSEGADVSQQVERLLLLRRALEEMLLNLSRLIPTEDSAPSQGAEVQQMFSWWREPQKRTKPRRR